MSPILVACGAEVVAAIFAILVARRRASFAPSAVALTLLASMSTIDSLIGPSLDAPALPYQGGPRLLFHLETALQLGSDATVAGLALVVAVPQRRRQLVSIVGSIWLLATLVLAVLYPSPVVSGLGLIRIYFASTLLGLAIGTIALVTRARASMAAKRSPDGNDMVVLTLVVFDAGNAAMAFWPARTGSLSPESYSGVHLLIIYIFGGIAAVEVFAWLLIRRR